MGKFRHFSAVLSLFLLVPASITWAQTISISGNVYEKGTVKNSFNTPHGKITTIFPDDMAPGDNITGTVRYEPAGDNPKKKNSNYRELAKCALYLKDGTPLRVTPSKIIPAKGDVSGNDQVSMTIPSNLSSLELILKDPANKIIGESRLPVLNKAFLMPVEDVFSITGRGVVVDSSKTKPRTYKPATVEFTTDKKIYLSGENAVLNFKPLVSNEEISRASFKFYNYGASGQERIYQTIDLTPVVITPRKAVVVIPPEAYGPGEIIIEDENKKVIASQKVHTIKLEAYCPKTSLLKDEETTLNVSVKNIQGLQAEYIRLTIENIYRSSIRVGATPCEHIIIDNSCYSGNSPVLGKNLNLLTDGVTAKSFDWCYGNSYEIQRPVVALQTGNFTINISLFYPSTVYNDPFRQQLDALKTPEQFRNWQDAFTRDLRWLSGTVINIDTDDFENRILNFTSAIKSPHSLGELDEAKSLAYSLARTFNLPAEVVEKYFSSTLAAGNAAVQNAMNSSGNEPVHTEVIESALRSAEHQALLSDNNQLREAAAASLRDSLLKLQQQMHNLNDQFQRLENIRKVIHDALKAAIMNMRSSINLPVPAENLIGYYNPLEQVLTVIAGKQQAVLNNLFAVRGNDPFYSMQSVNYYGEPVENTFRLQTAVHADFPATLNNTTTDFGYRLCTPLCT